MEAGVNRRRDLILLAAFTLLVHAPFLKQPVQGDEVTYLDIAQHVLANPLTPLNFQYVFLGKLVDAAGHPHPPLDAYLLAALAGRSLLFDHVFYLLFPLAISFAGYSLAARFTSRPLWGALLIAASPLVQVNTNTMASPESPALAFLLIGAAAFLGRRFWIAGIALGLSGLTELQALAIAPILLIDYLVKRERPSRGAWLALAAPYCAVGGWQAFQFAMTHRLPGATMVTLDQARGFFGLELKAKSALALLEHLGALIILVPLAWRRLWGLAPGVAIALMVHDYPWWQRVLLAGFVALGVNALLWLWESRRRNPLLAGWCLLYFVFAVVVFFAGASRYLLPLAAPMVLLFVLEFAERWRVLAMALAASLFLGLNLSFAAYEFARVYAEVAPPPGQPFLVNGDWGFRYYQLEHGGYVLNERSQGLPGEWIVSSDLSLGGRYDSLAEEIAVPMRTLDLTTRTPLRLIDLHAHSGFSAVSNGLLPFSFSRRPLDRIHYSRMSPFLDIAAPWMPTQFDGRLVYLPSPGASVDLPLDSPGSLLFALFARGNGTATFRIAGLFEKTAQVSGELWEEHTIPVAGLDDALLSIDAPPDLRAGWGEMVYDDHQGPAHISQREDVPYLNLGDIRRRRELVSGWYGIEDGGWRWMSRKAEAILCPSVGSTVFEINLFFPPDHMQRAGGPITVSVRVQGKPFARQTYTEPGGYRLTQPVKPFQYAGSSVSVDIELDRAVQPGPSDRRELGMVVSSLGFTAGK